MYRELGPDDHLRTLRLERQELPDVLLLVGVFDVQKGAQRFARYIEDSWYLPDERKGVPAWLGTYKGLKVAITAGLGGPMAAMHTHMWCGAGVPVVVQLGWFGALQPGWGLGDVLVPHHAERQEAVSDWYLAKGILADASPDLSAAIVSSLKAREVTAREGSIFTTPALMAESREVIADWSRHGWAGVDMETASTFAVAKSLGAKRAAALMRIDDLVAEEDSLVEVMERERLRSLRRREQEVTEAVLDALVKTTAADT